MKYQPVKAFLLMVLIAVMVSAFSKNNGVEHHHKQTKADTPLKIYKDPLVTSFFKRETGWIAADGAYSFPIGDGKVMWTFGDTFTNDYDHKTGTVPCLFNVRSCAMVQTLDDWDWHKTQTILNPEKSSLFHSDTTTNHFNWPAAGFALKDTAYVFCFNMKNVSTGMGFAEGGNNALAKIKLPEMTVAGYHILQDFNGIEFGMAFIKNPDGYIYVYGSRGNGPANTNAYVARFPTSNPNANWAFWDGSNWSNDAKAAAPIAQNHQAGLAVAKVKNKYLMLSTALSVGCDQGKTIYSQVSDSPTGPFSNEKLLYTLDDTVNGHYPFFYLAAAHPEYINNKDELLITYCINGYGNCVPSCVNNRYDPNFYRPRGIRVPLKLIDPSL